MDKEQLHEARTNPEFLDYLEKTRLDAIATNDIAALYEVLDSYLVLNLDEERINEVYQKILEISFENAEKIVNENRKLKLDGDDLYYVRALYEHGIEKWSYENFQGAKELIFVLSNIIDDIGLCEALKAHVLALSKSIDLDSFYDKEVDLNSCSNEEKYGYFITKFKYSLDEYLDENRDILEKEFNNLKHLLDN